MNDILAQLYIKYLLGQEMLEIDNETMKLYVTVCVFVAAGCVGRAPSTTLLLPPLAVWWTTSTKLRASTSLSLDTWYVV